MPPWRLGEIWLQTYASVVLGEIWLQTYASLGLGEIWLQTYVTLVSWRDMVADLCHPSGLERYSCRPMPPWWVGEIWLQTYAYLGPKGEVEEDCINILLFLSITKPNTSNRTATCVF
jgi:hypothetical protein